MWAIYNKKGCRMYQYPCYKCEEDAIRLLRKAQANNPAAGFNLVWIDEEEDD